MHFTTNKKVRDKDAFEKMGLSQDKLCLLIHTGSRGLGHEILQKHTNNVEQHGLQVGTPAFDNYMHDHDRACDWAKCNRELVALRFMEAIGAKGERVLDVWHNTVQNDIPMKFIADGDFTAFSLIFVLISLSNVPDTKINLCNLSLKKIKVCKRHVDGMEGDVWIHRKGAAPSDCGPVVIPGSRGAHSYLVKPIESEKVGA